MVDFQRFDSVDEVVAEVREQNSGTVFDYGFLAFQNFEEYIRFRLNADEQFLDSWYARIGESNDFRDMFGLVVDEFEYDESVFRQSLANAEDASYLDAVKFARDVLKYRRNEMFIGSFNTVEFAELVTSDSEWPTVSSEQVVDSLVEIYNFPELTEDEAHDEIVGFMSDVKSDSLELSNLISSLLGAGGADVSVSASDLSDLSLVQVMIVLLDLELELIESEISRYEFEEFEVPRVGEYVKYLTPYYDDASDEHIVYQVLLEVTDVFVVEKDGVEVVNFEYDVIEFDDELLDVFGGHFVVEDNLALGPEHQDSLFVHSGGVGSFETKVSLEETPYELDGL